MENEGRKGRSVIPNQSVILAKARISTEIQTRGHRERNKVERGKLGVRGQAMAEYVLILAVLTVVSAFALREFKNALEIYTNRIIQRVSNEQW